jgi:hypothetical protein
MPEPQEPTREIDMAKLLAEQADQVAAPKAEGVDGDVASPADPAQ